MLRLKYIIFIVILFPSVSLTALEGILLTELLELSNTTTEAAAVSVTEDLYRALKETDINQKYSLDRAGEERLITSRRDALRLAAEGHYALVIYGSVHRTELGIEAELHLVATETQELVRTILPRMLSHEYKRFIQETASRLYEALDEYFGQASSTGASAKPKRQTGAFLMDYGIGYFLPLGAYSDITMPVIDTAAGWGLRVNLGNPHPYTLALGFGLSTSFSTALSKGYTILWDWYRLDLGIPLSVYLLIGNRHEFGLDLKPLLRLSIVHFDDYQRVGQTQVDSLLGLGSGLKYTLWLSQSFGMSLQLHGRVFFSQPELFELGALVSCDIKVLL